MNFKKRKKKSQIGVLDKFATKKKNVIKNLDENLTNK